MDKKILFALLAVSSFLLLSAVSVTAPAGAKGGDKAILASNFRVEIDGISYSSFLGVEGLSTETEVTEYRSGDDPLDVSYIPGLARAGIVTLTGALTENREIWDWYSASRDGEGLRRDISVTILDRRGDAVRTFTLIDCFPTSYSVPGLDSTSDAVLHWTLEVRVDRIDMA